MDFFYNWGCTCFNSWWKMWNDACHTLRRQSNLFLAGQLVLGWCNLMRLSDLWQVEPAFLVGHLAGNSQSSKWDWSGKRKNRGWRKGMEDVDRRACNIMPGFQRCSSVSWCDFGGSCYVQLALCCMNWKMVGMSWEWESWEGRWFVHCADAVLGMCLCEWCFGGRIGWKCHL